MINELVQSILQGNQEESIQLFSDILKDRIHQKIEEVKFEVADDMLISDLGEGFLKSTVLGNVRAAYKIKQHEDKSKLFADAGMKQKADFHQKAADRLSKAYAKAQIKEEREITDKEVDDAYAALHHANVTDHPDKYKLQDRARQLSLAFAQQQSRKAGNKGFDPITGRAIKEETDLDEDWVTTHDRKISKALAVHKANPTPETKQAVSDAYAAKRAAEKKHRASIKGKSYSHLSQYESVDLDEGKDIPLEGLKFFGDENCLDEDYVVYNHDGKYNKIKKVVKNHATAQKHAEKLGGDHKVASMEYWQDKLAPRVQESADDESSYVSHASELSRKAYAAEKDAHSKKTKKAYADAAQAHGLAAEAHDKKHEFLDSIGKHRENQRGWEHSVAVHRMHTLGSQIKEETDLDEGKDIPLEGHPYHEKSDAELRYIIKDAGEAAKAMKNHSPDAESKYLDQVNDASTILWHRKRNQVTK